MKNKAIAPLLDNYIFEYYDAIVRIKNGEKVCLGQRTVLLRPDKTKVHPDFLVYYLLALPLQPIYGIMGRERADAW